ncbi:hypothetical protein, partial [Bhargavaea massiliensis]|uniref:hypothetical protein n=1 Tax=Bhargavaea massiliensis TaxID=2697500 RepID=UPI001BCBA986
VRYHLFRSHPTGSGIGNSFHQRFAVQFSRFMVLLSLFDSDLTNITRCTMQVNNFFKLISFPLLRRPYRKRNVDNYTTAI